MLLSKLTKINKENDIQIDQLSVDSRIPMHNAIFFCLNGIKYDGHEFIDEAIANGAKVIVYSKNIEKKGNALFLKCNNVNNVLNNMANKFYNTANHDIDKFIICGSYGKASVATFINYFLNLFSTCGYVGRFGINLNNVHYNSNYETLNVLENLEILDVMQQNNIKSCTFEVNSTPLSLQKINGLVPNYFIYTSTDLDIEDTYYDDYLNHIKNYFNEFKDYTKIIINADDRIYQDLKNADYKLITYGKNSTSDYQIRDVMLSRKGINYKIVHKDKIYQVKSSLQGLVNVYNLTATIVALLLKDYDMETILKVFEELPDVDGVMERVDEQYNIIVDSAYDLDSIENICEYASLIKQKNKAIGVISINYTDSDSRIQKIMNIAQKYLDIIILTENESLEGEVMDILKRCDKYTTNSRVVHVPYRSLAIENGIELMNENDVLIIIGKGNEKFLSLGLGKIDYQGDKAYAKKFINKRRKEENEII